MSVDNSPGATHRSYKGKYWLEDGAKECWVMGSVADKLLDKAAKTHAPYDYPSAHSLTKSRSEVCTPILSDGRRRKCQSLHVSRASNFKEHSHNSKPCKCERYDPVIVLPKSLFNKVDLAMDFESAAGKLLDEFFEEKGRDWHESGVVRDDFMIQIDDFTPEPLAWIPSSVAYFQIRKQARIHYMEEALSRHQDGATAKMDRAEFDLNYACLPNMLQWCEEYCFTKRALVKEAIQAVEQRIQDVPDHLKEQGAYRLEKATEEFMAELRWRGLGSTDAGLGANVGMKVDKNGHLTAPNPDRPRLTCRCGHAEVWHEPPVISNKQADTGPATKQLLRRPAAPLPLPARAKPELVLSGGRLVVRDASAPLLQSPHDLLFDRIDRNKDGIISPAEWDKAHADGLI